MVKNNSVLRIAQQHSANATAKANEVIANFRTVRAFANESYEDEKYGKLVSLSCGVNQVSLSL